MTDPDVRIAGVGTILPGPAVDNATLIRRFRVPAVWEQWVDTFIGTRSRHFALDLESGEVRYTMADMAEAAARRALAAAGADPGDIGLVVMGSATPDALMPATVNVVADRLGIDGVPTYQLLSGCTGAIQALTVASLMLRAGQCQSALVLGGDTCAPFLDLGMDLANSPSEVQVNVMLFGDGAGAAVLSTAPGSGPALVDVHHKLVGLGRSPGQVVEWYGRPQQAADRQPVTEDFKAVEEWAPRMAVDGLGALLARVGWTPTDLDYILPPQLSGRMTARIMDALCVQWAEEVNCVEEIANTANALPFFQLERVLPRMSPGERAAGLSVEASKWIIAGYALELPEGG